MDRLQPVLDEQRCLICEVRAVGTRDRRAIGLDGARGDPLAVEPFDPLDEAVAMIDRETPVIVDVPRGRGAQRIRPKYFCRWSFERVSSSTASGQADFW